MSRYYTNYMTAPSLGIVSCNAQRLTVDFTYIFPDGHTDLMTEDDVSYPIAQTNHPDNHAESHITALRELRSH